MPDPLILEVTSELPRFLPRVDYDRRCLVIKHGDIIATVFVPAVACLEGSKPGDRFLLLPAPTPGSTEVGALIAYAAVRFGGEGGPLIVAEDFGDDEEEA